MADEDKQFALQKIYIKDVSFETPNSPQVFTQKWEPKVEVNLSSNAQALQENLYEVSLTVTVTVKTLQLLTIGGIPAPSEPLEELRV